MKAPVVIDELAEYLKGLAQAATDACDAARITTPHIYGAINWGDLFCFEACFVIDDDGFYGYRVTIQEADPNNQEFHEFVQDYLKDRGYDAVVVTEW